VSRAAGIAGFEVPGADDRPIRGDARVAEQPSGAVVFCHGFMGFARGGFLPYLATRLADAGLNVITFDFSGSGVGADRETFSETAAFAANTFAKQLHDLDVVWREGERRDWLPAPAGLFGFSRGGGVAILYTAENTRVRALCTWSSIATINRWPAEMMREWRERGYRDVENARTHQILRIGREALDEIDERSETDLNILDAASRIRVPWLIVHGTADDRVPVHEGRQLHSASADRAELALIERASHTYDYKSGAEPTPELALAAARTVKFFRSNLGV